MVALNTVKTGEHLDGLIVLWGRGLTFISLNLPSYNAGQSDFMADAFTQRQASAVWEFIFKKIIKDYLQCSGMMGHGAAHPLIAAILLDVGDPLLTLTHDLRSLQVEVFVDHLQTHSKSQKIYKKEWLTVSCILYFVLLNDHLLTVEDLSHNFGIKLRQVLLQIEAVLLKMYKLRQRDL